MVPYADQLNHENVDVNYDCLDPVSRKSYLSKEELEARRKQEEEDAQNKRKEFLTDLKKDLDEMAKELDKEFPDKQKL